MLRVYCVNCIVIKLCLLFVCIVLILTMTMIRKNCCFDCKDYSVPYTRPSPSLKGVTLCHSQHLQFMN